MPDTSNTPVSSPLTAGTAPDEMRTASSAIEGLLGDESEDPTTEPEETQEETADEPSTEEEVQEDEDAESEDEHQEPEETEQESPRSIRLSDGRTMTLADVEKGLLRQDDYTRKTQALAEERKAIEASKQRNTQAETQIQQALERAAAMLQRDAPQPPDPALAITDTGEYVARQATFDAWKRRWEEVNQEYVASQQRQHEQEQQARDQYLKREREALYQTMPEMRDPAKRQAFNQDLEAFGIHHYGLTREDISDLADHRHARILADAFAYRKLQAMKNAKGKATPVPVKGPAPAGASPRPAKGVARQKIVRQDMDRLRKSGREGDAAALLEKHFLK